MNLTPNEQSDQLSNSKINNDSDKNNEKKITKKRKAIPKTHNHEFNMKSIIHSVAGIGVGSANDFSFANIHQKEHDLVELNLDDSIPATPIREEKSIETKRVIPTTKRKTASKEKRSKKINKAKLQKVFKTNAFKKSNGTIKILPGLSKLVNQASNRSAREIVSELLIKWLIKEHPQLEAMLLELLDQNLDAG